MTRLQELQKRVVMAEFDFKKGHRVLTATGGFYPYKDSDDLGYHAEKLIDDLFSSQKETSALSCGGLKAERGPWGLELSLDIVSASTVS